MNQGWEAAGRSGPAPGVPALPRPGGATAAAAAPIGADDAALPGRRAFAWLNALLIDHAIFRLVWSNFSVVIPGRLYRSNHPTPGRLARQTRRYGLKALINLRGRQRGNGADALGRAIAARLGIEVIDVALKGRVAPDRDSIERLHDIYVRIEEPALMHCKSGADRTGFAAGAFILFHGGCADDALRQLSPRFGHIRQARTGILDAFFRRYRSDGEGRKPFLDWVREDYDRDTLHREFHANRLASFIADRVLLRE